MAKQLGKFVLSNKLSSQGFTLMELLIAVAIFSVVSLASFSIFNTVLTGDETSKLRNERLNDMQRAFLLIERDFTQMTKRTMRVSGEAPTDNFLQTSDDSFLEEEQAIVFVRNGWTNPGMLLPRSDVQSVSYRLVDQTLERLHFNFVDAVVGQEPRVRPLLKDVTALSIEFYDGTTWQEKWSGDALPLAIAVELELLDYGLVRRQYLVPSDYEPGSKKGSNGS